MSSQQNARLVDPRDYYIKSLTYIGVSVIWVAFTIFWIANCIIFRKQKVPLHRILIIVPLLKLLNFVFESIMYWECSVKAITEPIETLNCKTVYFYINNVIEMLYRVSLFVALILIAKGFFITRRHFEPQEKKAIIWNVFCLGVCLIAIQLNGFFLIPLIVIYVILFGIVFSSIVLNVRALHSQLIVLQETTGVAPQENPAYHKISLFRKLQYILTIYLLFKMLLVLTVIVLAYEASSTFSKHILWVDVLSEELPEAITVLLVGFVFRLRDFSRFARFNDLPEEDYSENADIQIVVDDIAPMPTTSAPNTSSDQDYRPVLQLARLPEHRHITELKEVPVVLIEHPGSSDGVTHTSYSIATEPSAVQDK